MDFLSYLFPTRICKVGIVTPILQIRKPRLQEIKWLAQGHMHMSNRQYLNTFHSPSWIHSLSHCIMLAYKFTELKVEGTICGIHDAMELLPPLLFRKFIKALQLQQNADPTGLREQFQKANFFLPWG